MQQTRGPVDIVQSKIPQLAGSNAQPRQQCNESPISTASIGARPARTENCRQFVRRESLRQIGISPATYSRNCAHQLRASSPFRDQETKERSDGRNDAAVCGSRLGGLSQNEI